MKSVATLSYFLMLVALTSADMLTGGITQINVKDNDLTVKFVMGKINEHFADNQDTAPRTLEKVLSASSQVVQGQILSYVLEITGGPNGNEVCGVKVWKRDWLEDVQERMMIVGPIDCNTE